MKHVFLMRLYRNILRLYPRAFRDEFTDEMADVFALHLNAAENPLSLVRFLARETVHFPFSVAAEHWAAYRKSPIPVYQGERLMFAMPSEKMYRRTAWSLIIYLIPYTLLVLLPFFFFGLHHEPVSLVRGGFFDPKGLALFNSLIAGCSVLTFAYLFLLTAPVVGILCALVLGAGLRRHWRGFTLNRRAIGITALTLAVTLFAFPFTSLGRTIFIWLLD